MEEPQEPVTPEDKLSRFIFGPTTAPDPKDDQIAALQKQVQAIGEKAAEERFLWVLTIIVAGDVAFLGSMSNWSAPIVIGLVELIGIVIWADRCQVNAVAVLLDKLIGFAKTATGRSSPTSAD